MIYGSIEYREYLDNLVALGKLEREHETQMRKAEQAGSLEYNEARRRQQSLGTKWEDFQERLSKLRSRYENILTRMPYAEATQNSGGQALLRDAGDLDILLWELAKEIEHCEQSLAWIERNQ